MVQIGWWIFQDKDWDFYIFDSIAPALRPNSEYTEAAYVKKKKNKNYDSSGNECGIDSEFIENVIR